MAALKVAGVAHFCYVSAHGASPDHPSAFVRIKYAVEQYLQASGLPYTIVRPTAFLQTHAYQMLGQSIQEQGKATIFGKGTGRRNFVAVEDVASLIEAVWDDAQAVGQIIEIGGPAANSLTNNEVAAMFERAPGRPAKISHVPRAMLRVMSPVLRPFHPGLSQLMAFALHDDLRDTTYDAAPLSVAVDAAGGLDRRALRYDGCRGVGRPLRIFSIKTGIILRRETLMKRTLC